LRKETVVEFWIGLSVGMHLGRVIADYLEKFVEAYGLLEPEKIDKIKEIEAVAGDIGSLVDEVED
jgi:hypothetical protein